MTSIRRTLPPPEGLTLFPLVDEGGDRREKVQDDVVEVGPMVCGTPDRRDIFNGRLLDGLTLIGHYQIPRIERCDAVPKKLIAFSEAMARRRQPDPDAWVHFYEDDYKFARFWNSPERYLERLRAFAGVISPDHSLYRNMPRGQQIGSTYQNQLLGAWLQADGISVIANVRLSGRDSIPFALAGVPRRSTIALGLHGCTKDTENRKRVIEEMAVVCENCEPSNLVVYGSSRYGVLDHPLRLGIPVHHFAPDTRERSKVRNAA